MGRPVRQFETNGWLAVATLGLGCCLAATESERYTALWNFGTRGFDELALIAVLLVAAVALLCAAARRGRQACDDVRVVVGVGAVALVGSALRLGGATVPLSPMAILAGSLATQFSSILLVLYAQFFLQVGVKKATIALACAFMVSGMLQVAGAGVPAGFARAATVCFPLLATAALVLAPRLRGGIEAAQDLEDVEIEAEGGCHASARRPLCRVVRQPLLAERASDRASRPGHGPARRLVALPVGPSVLGAGVCGGRGAVLGDHAKPARLPAAEPATHLDLAGRHARAVRLHAGGRAGNGLLSHAARCVLCHAPAVHLAFAPALQGPGHVVSGVGRGVCVLSPGMGVRYLARAAFGRRRRHCGHGHLLRRPRGLSVFEVVRLFAFPADAVAEEDGAADGVPDAFARGCSRAVERCGLSPRESQVLPFLAKGRNARYIAGELIISDGTARTHIMHIYQKLGVHTQQELIDVVEGMARE